MAKEITMPKLSDTMSEGLFAGWRKNIGDRIERGDIIAEVETDKAVMELEAFSSGVLIKTMAKDGELVPVGTVLGLIGEPGELTETAEPVATAIAPPATASPSPQAPAISETPRPAPEPHETDHEKASPLVRRLARDQGIDLGRIQGSGPEGRITQEDLATFAAHTPIPAKPATVPAVPPTAVSETGVAEAPPPSSMRQAISAAVSHSWQTIPHFTVTVEIHMDACREIVEELKESTHPVGYNALLIKACASALQHFPLLRSAGTPGEGLHINFAVALSDGVLMPTLRRCDTLTVAEIEQESIRLIDKCRNGKLTSEEMSAGCFSVSNLGMYGVDEFTALIMPGQTAILAVGAVTDRAIVRNGALVPAVTMRITLSSDHRAVDGAYAARFLAALRALLEKPVSLVIQP
jgi:pyruvate dehydrogenase E2 component (dihydrolipoamide acetyltransferase)